MAPTEESRICFSSSARSAGGTPASSSPFRSSPGRSNGAARSGHCGGNQRRREKRSDNERLLSAQRPTTASHPGKDTRVSTGQRNPLTAHLAAQVWARAARQSTTLTIEAFSHRSATRKSLLRGTYLALKLAAFIARLLLGTKQQRRSLLSTAPFPSLHS